MSNEAPMIEALRESDAVKLSRFDDLRSLNDHIGVVLSRAVGGVPGSADVGMATPAESTESPTAQNIGVVLVASLKGLGVAEDVAKALVDEAVAKSPSGDPLLLMEKIVSTLKASPPKVRPPKPKPPLVDELPEDDLRRLVVAGMKNQQSAYEALLAAGVVRPPMMDFAA